MLSQDFRYALRTLQKNLGFSVLVITTLALGIGASTAMFSIVDAILLRPLPYAQSERLVSIWPDGAFPRGGFALLDREHRSYSSVGGFTFESEYSLTGVGEPLRIQGVEVTPGLFSTLGVRAELGRTLVGEDDSAAARTVVLGHALWRRRFGSDPQAIGRLVRLDGVDYTVVGVMPRDFRFPSPATEFWISATFDPTDMMKFWGGPSSLRAVGRLADSATIVSANAELKTIVARLRAAHPWNMGDQYGSTAIVRSLRDQWIGDSRRPLLVLLVAVGFLLLIGCVNVANLFLVRARKRQRELAIRTAIGASPRQIVRQLVIDSLLLGVLGGGVGVLGAIFSLDLLIAGLPADTPRVAQIAIDGRVLAFSLALSVGTGIVLGLFPAWRSARPDLQGALREGSVGAGSSRGQRHFVNGLVAIEVALAAVLVIGAGMLIQSFWNLLRVDPGFSTDRVLTAKVAPSPTRFRDDAERRVFLTEVVDRLNAAPGVLRAGVASHIPFGGGIYSAALSIEGREQASEDDWPIADAMLTVSPDFLKILGIPRRRGRFFTEADREDAPGVAIISESLASKYWRGRDPIGARISFPGPPKWMTIVGVVGDIKLDQVAGTTQSALYLPVAQGSTGPMFMAISTSADSDKVAKELRQVVLAIDRDTPVSDVRGLESVVGQSLHQPRFVTMLLALFAFLALILGAVGTYGVTEQAVSQRRREVAMRMALGSSPREALWLLLRQGLAICAIGLGIGTTLALAFRGVLSSLLYGVSKFDPVAFLAVPLVLAFTVMLSCYIPARRVIRADPLKALRSE